ncbi:MAG: hypothetical protein ACI95R_000520 [Halioglobus sp.]|jgi:hypothetical protein
MGGKTKRFEINLKQLALVRAALAERRAYIDFLTAMMSLEDVYHRGELTAPAASLHTLSLITRFGPKDDFDWDRYGEMVKAYNEPLIPLPASIVYALGEAWNRYLDDPDGDLGAAFQTKGGTGKRSARTTIENLTHQFTLAGLIQQELFHAQFPRFGDLTEEEGIKLAEAIARVAEKYADDPLDISERTLQRAWIRWGEMVQHIARSRMKGPE